MNTLTVGRPVWTTGHFERVAALDDLGIEALGAGLLRELLPGAVQTSISAGYYAYYPFLLDEFERRYPDDLERSSFRRFYRHQEAAYAVACSLHDHRGELRGINGTTKASAAGEQAGETGTVDLDALAAPGGYMKSNLGGYGLFYRPALEDIGLTRLGAGNRIVDRNTDLGRQAADGFRSIIEDTEYWKRWADAQAVPVQVLAELGEAACLCQVPGRADHQPVVDTLFHHTGDSQRWNELHRYRTQSFGLLLEFHTHRPDDQNDVGAWRRALVSGRLGDRAWATSFLRHREAWRAYQYREVLVAALTTTFAASLELLDIELQAASPDQLERAGANLISWARLGVNGHSALEDLIELTAELRSEPEQLIAVAEEGLDAFNPKDPDIEGCLTSAFRLAAGLAEPPTGDPEFTELLDRGGAGRLSLAHMSRWLRDRRSNRCEDVAAELIQLLFYRHLRVATGKLTATDHRDPFCVAAQEDGTYRVIRRDEPFWTGARFDTMNHLLWTAGALDQPDGNTRPTELGRTLLSEVQADA